MKNAKADSNLDQLSIVPSCEITRLVIDFEADKAKLVTVAEVPYTPKAIGQQFQALGLIGEAFWVIGPTGKELWRLDSGAEIAHQV